jgi:hypothetical protein
MVARIRHEPNDLLVMLHRDGQETQSRRAVGGEQALLLAVSMLIGCGRLRSGDQLIVQGLGGETDENPAG